MKVREKLGKIVWRFGRDLFNAQVYFPSTRDQYETGIFTEVEFQPTKFVGVKIDWEDYERSRSYVFQD